MLSDLNGCGEVGWPDGGDGRHDGGGCGGGTGR